jgi:hypothetical protein
VPIGHLGVNVSDLVSAKRVLNIGKLRKGVELYYLNSVARGVEDYYVGSGKAPGYRLASGAKDLGLTDAVGEGMASARFAHRSISSTDRHV